MKIHHVTMPAFDPPKVAAVLAELSGGRAVPMPHPEDAWLVYAGDEDGTLLEIWPAATRAGVLEHATHLEDLPPPARWPHHAYVSVPTDEATILRVFEREGWPAEKVHQGPPHSGFTLIRGWIEKQQVIELATAEMAAQYAGFIRAMSAPR